jgi:hypothetical protein
MGMTPAGGLHGHQHCGRDSSLPSDVASGDDAAVGVNCRRAGNREAATTIIRIGAILLAMVGIATQERAAVAQAYPSKPVKLIVPYAPGSPNDIIARILAQKLAEGLGGSFFVENTAGAGGTKVAGYRN